MGNGEIITRSKRGNRVLGKVGKVEKGAMKEKGEKREKRAEERKAGKGDKRGETREKGKRS